MYLTSQPEMRSGLLFRNLPFCQKQPVPSKMQTSDHTLNTPSVRGYKDTAGHMLQNPIQLSSKMLVEIPVVNPF